MTTRVPDSAVVHDYFAIRGGGERLVLELASAMGASLVFGYATPDSYARDCFPDHLIDLHLPTVLQRPGLRTIALALRYAQLRSELGRYETRVYSGTCAPLAAPSIGHAGGVNVLYCHTPPRFLYDQRESNLSKANPAKWVGLRSLIIPMLKPQYEAAVARMQLIVANSENVRRRVKRYLGRESTVVYPPIDTNSFVWNEPEGYYLSTARLTPLKRVEIIIEAFKLLPHKRLVIASGGDQEPELRRQAADAANITFVGWVSEGELRSLMAKSIATIYVPIDEDFGMSPVESMAAGKPVIGVAEGGLLETILDGETGFLVSPEFSAEVLADAVDRMTVSRALDMRSACVARASSFGRSRFIDEMEAAISRLRV